jgi:hypothetical protein
MKSKLSWTHIKYALTLAVALGAAGAAFNFVGCSSSTTATTAALTDPYVYYSYYPSDVAVSAYYWTDDWAYTGLYALGESGINYGTAGAPATPAPTVPGTAGAPGTAGITGTAGALGTAGAPGTAVPVTAGVVTTVADALRALARGEAVCPTQVTVTPKTSTPACTGGPTQTRSGVTIAFSGCQTAGGGNISGTVDVTATRTATSAVCTGTTSITLSHTTTINNLSYTSPSGIRLIIPMQTDTSMTTFTNGQIPASVTFTTTGELQIYAVGGALVSDTSYTGSPTISFGGSPSAYTVDGTFSTTDNRLAGAGSTVTLTGITRVNSCCRPIAGSVQVAHNSGVTNTWTFGPTCSDLVLDGQTVSSLPACL